MDIIYFLTKHNWARGTSQSLDPEIQTFMQIIRNQTSFLPDSAKIAQRRWHILNNNFNVQKCNFCNNPVKWNTSKKHYAKYCSSKCLKNSPDTKNKFKNTIRYKYDVLGDCRKPPKLIWKTLSPTVTLDDYSPLFSLSTEYSTKKISQLYLKDPQTYRNLLCVTSFLNKNSTIRNRLWHIDHRLLVHKTCNTCINIVKWVEQNNDYNKYCDTCFNSLNIKENKKLATINQTYGSMENYISQIKKTSLEKYGVDNYTKTDEYKERMKKANNLKYGVDYYVKTAEFKEKSKNTFIKNYGVDSYSKTEEYKQSYPSAFLREEVKIKSKSKVWGKYEREFFNQAHIPLEVLTLLSDKNWLIKQHFELKTPCYVIAKNLNVNLDTVLNRFKYFNLCAIRFNQSVAEKEICSLLQNNNVIFTINDRKLIAPLELDIYIPDKKIAIEYCGLYWHNEIAKDNNYHYEKYKKCKEQGIRLIQIFEDEWINKRTIVENKILYILGISQKSKVYARKCTVTKISQEEKKTFFDKTHIQGDGPSSINYGLFYENKIVAAMGFIQQNNQYILNRYSTDLNVVGGFTKLLKYFEINEPVKDIITFADLRWSEGDLYSKTGFTFSSILPPDYTYIIRTNRIHKFNFRHKGMKHKLENYDSNLSEHENMLNNKIYRIYDSGKIKFVKHYG